MIRLLEDENSSNLKLYDTVSYAGHYWYVIGKRGNEVTLLAAFDDYGRYIFDEESDNYKTSKIRKYLNSTILSELESKGANPIPTNLSDVGCTDNVYLLSVEEAEKLPMNKSKFGKCWWLRSRGLHDISAAFVWPNGGVYDSGCYVDNDLNEVRPAMKVSMDELR